jgi:hypothetical protein
MLDVGAFDAIKVLTMFFWANVEESHNLYERVTILFG